MASFQTPMDPFDFTIGEGLANQHEFLVAYHWERFRDAHHRAMVLADQPGLVGAIGRDGAGRLAVEISDVALAAAQIGKALQSLLQGPLTDLVAIVGCLDHGLLLEQLCLGLGGQGGRHGLEQAQGKGLIAIGEAAMACHREPPAIAGAARSGLGAAGFDQLIFLQAAQVSPHHLDGNRELLGEFSGSAFPLAHQHSQGSLPGRRCLRCDTGSVAGLGLHGWQRA